MLLQSHADAVHLLPALPGKWRDGKVSGLRARGAFEVEMQWSNGILEQAVITSVNGNVCKVRYGNLTTTFQTDKGSSYTIRKTGDSLTVQKR